MLHLIKYANAALLVLFPISWFAPLARAGVLPFFGMSEISVVSAIQALLEDDLFLALVVGAFALIAPILKIAATAAVQFRLVTKRALPVLDILGKLAMADVFLIAVYVVLAKGVGIGRVETAWGLYLFTACVIGSMVITYLTRKALR